MDLKKLPSLENHTFNVRPGRQRSRMPVLVFEISVSDESFDPGEEVDRHRYFARDTGVRWWCGVKVFKEKGNKSLSWWCGHAKRDQKDNVFVKSSTMQAGSMPEGETDFDIKTPFNQVFQIDVAWLVHPCPLPHNYPATIDIDMEKMRLCLVEGH